MLREAEKKVFLLNAMSRFLMVVIANTSFPRCDGVLSPKKWVAY
jgi:hypothetical protein